MPRVATHGCVLAVLAALAGSARAQPAAPAFSQAGGFFDASVEVELSAASGAVIHYTLDGSMPTEQSPRYARPLSIGPAGELPERTEPPLAPAHLPRGTVVLARAFSSDGASPVVGHTYWVAQPAIDAAVVSLAADADGLFGTESGIYVRGAKHRPNYVERGPSSERPVHVELYETDGTRAVALPAGLRLHGRSSRAMAVKALRVFARKRYGAAAIEYPIFPDLPHTRYKRLLLRNAGQDLERGMSADVYGQTLMAGLRVDAQAWRPVVVFINGEHWGVLHLRERLDDRYLRAKYGADREHLVIVKAGAELEHGAAGSERAWVELLGYVADKDLASEGPYARVAEQVDLDSYIDFAIAHIYAANPDWRAGGRNESAWRTARADPAHPMLDGRWRWFLFDLDVGFRQRQLQLDSMALAATHPLFGALSDNPAWRARFAARVADLLNTQLAPDRAVRVHDEVVAALAPLMPAHIERWRVPRAMALWEKVMGQRREFAAQRPAIVRAQVDRAFDLGGTATLELAVDGQGVVEVGSTRHSVAAAPWRGSYFRRVPVQLRAVPAPGWSFSHWQGAPEHATADVAVEVAADRAVTAVFVRGEGLAPRAPVATASTTPWPWVGAAAALGVLALALVIRVRGARTRRRRGASTP